MGAWQSVTINISGEGDIYQGYLRRDNANLIREFYDYGTNPRSNVLLSNDFSGADNLWSPGDCNFTADGVDLSSIPYLDATLGGKEYNIYYESGSNFIYYSNDSGSGTIGTDPSGDPSDVNKVTCTFSDLSQGIWIRLDTLWGGVTRNDFYFRIDGSDPPQVQEFYSYDLPDVNILSDSQWWSPDNAFYPKNDHVSGNFVYLNITSIPALDQTVGGIIYQIYPSNNIDDGLFEAAWTFTGTDGSPPQSRITTFQGAFSTLLGRPVIQRDATFRARRPQSSSELLALQRIKIEKTLNIPPSINLQDSSEVTARIRKGASVLKTASLPGQPTKGNSGNMVKFNDSSVVQAMLEGNVYREAACNYQPRQQRLSWLTPPRILDDQITYPKAVGSSYQISNSAPRVVGFDPVLEFGWRKNDNKAVFLNPPTVAIPATANFSYEAVNDVVASCSGAVGSPVILMTNVSVQIPITSIEVVGYQSTWSEGDPGEYYIYVAGITLPRVGEPDAEFPFVLLMNNGKYTTSGSVTITDHFGVSPSTAQLYEPYNAPTDTGGSLYFPATSAAAYMCAGSNSDFFVPAGTDFTVMWWQNLTNNTQYPRIFDMGSSYEGTTGVSIESTGTNFLFWNGNGYTSRSFSASVNDTNWHHVAMIRTISDNVLRIYRDGVSNAQINYSGAFGSTNSNALFLLGIRRDTEYLSEAANGYITQFVFDNGLARYTEDFTPPTTVTADPSYTVLLLNVSSQATAGQDDSGRNHNFGFYADLSSNAAGFAPRIDVSGG